MSSIEDLLRDAYQDAARTVVPDSIRPDVLHQAPRVQRRLNRFAPLAAALAVAVLAAGVVLTPHLLPGHRKSAGTGAAGTPPFVVVLPYYGTATGPLAVQAAGTRHVTARVAPPPGRFWAGIAATGSETRFIAAATDGRICETLLYSLTVSASGRATVTQLRAIIVGRLDATTSLAASANGSVIAYASQPCSAQRMPAAQSVRLGAISLGRGIWQRTLAPAEAPVNLSLSADGTLLSYVTRSTFIWGKAVSGNAGHAPGAWLVPLGTVAAGTLPSGILPPGHEIFTGSSRGTPVAGSLSADGQTIYLMTQSSPSRNLPSLVLAAYRTSNGTRERILHIWRSVVPVDPALTRGGDHLLAWGITQPGTYRIDLPAGRLTTFWVLTPDGESPEALAW